MFAQLWDMFTQYVTQLLEMFTQYVTQLSEMFTCLLTHKLNHMLYVCIHYATILLNKLTS